MKQKYDQNWIHWKFLIWYIFAAETITMTRTKAKKWELII